jgi:hypothetical protein
MFESQRARLKDLYARHSRWFPVAFFVLGFLFDVMMITRIDETAVIIQQILYLFVVGALITVEIFSKVRPIEPPRLLRKVWPYREFAMTFALGTLLNSFTIFFFKSASGMTSFFFVAILVAAITLSEFKKFGESQTLFQVVLLSLSLICSFQCWVPMLFGFSGAIPFLAAGFASALCVLLWYRFLKPRLAARPGLLKSHIVYPYSATLLVFSLLYFLHVLPPVPLSVSYMGIYHQAEKIGDEYRLGYTRPWYRFWERGDETFLARPGDTVVAYVQVFSPSGFRDQLQVRWSWLDPRRGWQSQDAIPLTVTGGREEGFRATTRKSNYQPGSWRVQVETPDSREVGRIGFRIIPDESTDERVVRFDEK